MGEIVEIVVSMLGGLALFLYGMRMMSNGLELTAGNSCWCRLSVPPS